MSLRSLPRLFFFALDLPEESRENLFYPVEEVKFLRKLVRVPRTYHCTGEHAMEDRVKTTICKMVAFMEQHELYAAYFVKRAAQTAQIGV